MSGVRGYDNLYNEHINDIALLNYNKGIAHRLRMQEQQMDKNLPWKEPKLLSGGVRPSNMIQPGTGVEAVPRAVGGRAFRPFTGTELPSQGGINRLKKSQRWTKYAKDTISDAIGIAKMAGMGSGGVNRLKKSQRWTKYAKDTIGDAFDIAKMAGMGSGGVNRLKKSQRWTKYAKDTIGDAFDIAKMTGMGKSKMVYSPELRKALGGCGECEGGKKPRKARLVKGSAEAKAWGAKMKAARDAKK